MNRVNNSHEVMLPAVYSSDNFLLLVKSDRPSDSELQKLAQRLVKPDGEAWEEEELVDIRLAEDLKRRQQQKRGS